eukprot:PhF_6_TR3360/c0_g2_i1/m.4777/K22071/FDX2; ferredoxin-2, mitochondrial
MQRLNIGRGGALCFLHNINITPLKPSVVASSMLFAQPMRFHGSSDRSGEPVHMTWIDPKTNSQKEVIGHVGQTLLDVSRDNEIGLEAACEASLACSTCHCILEEKIYDALAAPSEAEEDLLDLAFDLRPTSRLGCQVRVSKEMEGTKITLPTATRNMAVDGYKAPAH